jgi:hypothetical protein
MRVGPITTGGDIVTVGPTTGPVTNVTVGGVGTTGLGTVPLGPTTNGPDGDPSAFGAVVNPGGY